VLEPTWTSALIVAASVSLEVISALSMARRRPAGALAL
jgi:hypothetical protein